MNEQTAVDVIVPADLTALSPEERAVALVKGTWNLYVLMDGAVCAVLQAQLGKSEIEQAIAATYDRITLLLRGIAALDDPAHFQIANSVARTVFELVLDLKMLRADPTLAAKFFAFARVTKFRKAESLVRFLNANPSVDRAPHEHAINFASDAQRKQEVEQQCVQYWGTKSKVGGPNWPEHWSGKRIADRARDAGLQFEEMYRSQFFLHSLYVHSGLGGVQDLSREALVCSFGIAHRLIQQLAAIATELVGEQFRLFDADPELRERLRAASAASGFYAVQAVLRQQSSTIQVAADPSGLFANVLEEGSLPPGDMNDMVVGPPAMTTSFWL